MDDSLDAAVVCPTVRGRGRMTFARCCASAPVGWCGGCGPVATVAEVSGRGAFHMCPIAATHSGVAVWGDIARVVVSGNQRC